MFYRQGEICLLNLAILGVQPLVHLLLAYKPEREACLRTYSVPTHAPPRIPGTALGVGARPVPLQRKRSSDTYSGLISLAPGVYI